ncbi:MAG: hypothetical protein O9972_37850 [Burkholderiales bacterium]|nr:hypothetical protein [Burkholderiales bacterium]
MQRPERPGTCADTNWIAVAAAPDRAVNASRPNSRRTMTGASVVTCPTAYPSAMLAATTTGSVGHSPIAGGAAAVARRRPARPRRPGRPAAVSSRPGRPAPPRPRCTAHSRDARARLRSGRGPHEPEEETR